MAQAIQLKFTYAEVVYALIRAAGIHEGRWTVTVFTDTSGGVGADGTPMLVTRIGALGLSRIEGEAAAGQIVIDAAAVNPRPAEGTAVN